MIDAEPSDVTVVIATYARPDALVAAVKSVRLQSCRRWRALVVGDGCDSATADAMDAFRDDPRIAYVNLPWRCGGQALPNSAGMAVARTDYIALLNHDDVWMPEHLAVALDRLRTTGGDFYLGRAAFGRTLEGSTDIEPVFDEVSAAGRTLREAFWRHYMYVEPASTWVVRRDLAERVGPWRQPAEIFRYPIVDWALRAWRAGARVAQDERVTCLKFETPISGRARTYDSPAAGQEWCVELLGTGRSEAIASRVAALATSPGTPHPDRARGAAPLDNERAQEIGVHLLTPEMADLYVRSGLDAFDWLCIEAGIPRGGRLRATFRIRTGEDPPSPPPLAEIVDHVREALRRLPGWGDT